MWMDKHMTRNEYRKDPDWSEYCEILQETVDIELERGFVVSERRWLHAECELIDNERRLERRKTGMGGRTQSCLYEVP